MSPSPIARSWSISWLKAKWLKKHDAWSHLWRRATEKNCMKHLYTAPPPSLKNWTSYPKKGTILKGKGSSLPIIIFDGKLLVFVRGSKFEFLSVKVTYPVPLLFQWEFPSTNYLLGGSYQDARKWLVHQPHLYKPWSWAIGGGRTTLRKGRNIIYILGCPWYLVNVL